MQLQPINMLQKPLTYCHLDDTAQMKIVMKLNN